MMLEAATYAPSTVATSSVAAAGARALKLMDPDCTVPACGCPYTDDLRRPLNPATRVHVDLQPGRSDRPSRGVQGDDR